MNATEREMSHFYAAGGVIEILPAKKISRKRRIEACRSGKWKVHNCRITPKRELPFIYKSKKV